MAFVPVFQERVEAGPLYVLLLDRLETLDGTPVERAELRLSLLFALRRQDAFLTAFDAAAAPLAPANAIIARRWRTNMAALMCEPRARATSASTAMPRCGR